MLSINKVTLLGHIGQDPKIGTTEKGKKFANFSIATNTIYKTKEGDKKESVDWHNCVAWNETATIAEKVLKKGTHVYVEGRLKTKEYENKEGVKVRDYEVIVSLINCLDPKEKQESVPVEGEDDLPY